MLWTIVHNARNEEIYVNLNQITSMKRAEKITYLNLNMQGYIEAIETPDEILEAANMNKKGWESE